MTPRSRTSRRTGVAADRLCRRLNDSVSQTSAEDDDRSQRRRYSSNCCTNTDQTTKGRELKVSHVAERNALWALSAQLEKNLIAPFQTNYADLLSKARARIGERRGSW